MNLTQYFGIIVTQSYFSTWSTLAEENTTKTIKTPMKLGIYRNYFLFGALSKIPAKIANSKNIQDSKTTKGIFYKTWKGKRQNIENTLRQIN